MEKPFTLGPLRLSASVDVFNVFYEDTILPKRRSQNPSNAGYASSIVPPRVVRFGMLAIW
ncbi:MAG TPA: hypothetical protein VK886_06070 [Vicinamibacterales bacterium]|nr:hypothetical protein [Vicinamibacterales bacterium]